MKKQAVKTHKEFLEKFENIHGIVHPEEYTSVLDTIREMVNASTDLHYFESISSILGNSERFNLLDYLSTEAFSVGDLQVRLKKAQSTVSHHLKIIEEAGFILAYKNSRFTNFSLNKEIFEELNHHLDLWCDGICSEFHHLTAKPTQVSA